MIERIKKVEKIKESVKEVKSNLDFIRNNLKLLKKKNLVKKSPCEVSSVVIPPFSRNYTEKEYKDEVYSNLKNSTFTMSEIDELCKSMVNQTEPIFKPESKNKFSFSEDEYSTFDELEVVEKDEIFFESSNSEISTSESESE